MKLKMCWSAFSFQELMVFTHFLPGFWEGPAGLTELLSSTFVMSLVIDTHLMFPVVFVLTVFLLKTPSSFSLWVYSPSLNREKKTYRFSRTVAIGLAAALTQGSQEWAVLSSCLTYWFQFSYPFSFLRSNSPLPGWRDISIGIFSSLCKHED